jgi:putative transposase
MRPEDGMARPPLHHVREYAGPPRYLTLRTHHRARHFRSPDVVARTLMEFLRLAQLEEISILAYCFMPDHLHLLVERTHRRADLGTFVRLARQHSGRAHLNVHGALLWQEGYHERALRAQDDERDVARYILHNPVRAGLVRTPRDYPFLGSSKWSLEDVLRGPAR